MPFLRGVSSLYSSQRLCFQNATHAAAVSRPCKSEETLTKLLQSWSTKTKGKGTSSNYTKSVLKAWRDGLASDDPRIATLDSLIALKTDLNSAANKQQLPNKMASQNAMKRHGGLLKAVRPKRTLNAAPGTGAAALEELLGSTGDGEYREDELGIGEEGRMREADIAGGVEADNGYAASGGLDELFAPASNLSAIKLGSVLRAHYTAPRATAHPILATILEVRGGVVPGAKSVECEVRLLTTHDLSIGAQFMPQVLAVFEAVTKGAAVFPMWVGSIRQDADSCQGIVKRLYKNEKVMHSIPLDVLNGLELLEHGKEVRFRNQWSDLS